MTNNAETLRTNLDRRDAAPIWIASTADLSSLLTELSGLDEVAVDTESDSLYSYFEKVCLLQLSTRGADYLVDPLAVSIDRFESVFASPRTQKVFHAAEYDMLCLKRDYHFEFSNIFDTMIAARILGWRNVGLGSILEERFGIRLNKKMQRADWGRRPLTHEHIAYAREDTHYLLALRDLQLAELERLGRVEEAREEFERLTRVAPTPRQFDPDGYWNIPGARELDEVALGVLRELYAYRDAQARRQDRPPFRILSDATLIRISAVQPSTHRELARVAGISDYAMQRYARSILEAVARGKRAPQATAPRPRARGDAPLDNSARARLGRLKEWRKQRADKRGVAPDVIVSNDVLIAAARHNPRTFEALVSATELGPWKAREYGEELLRVLQGKRQ